MDTVELIVPRRDLEVSHRAFVEEFRAEGEEPVPWVVGEPYTSLDEYVKRLDAAAKGIGLPAGSVPHSTFWLIDAQGEILAVSNLRHVLTDYLRKWGGHIGYGVRPGMRRKGYGTEILRQTLLKARALGLRTIRLTCDRDNVASARTILRNGGKLDDEELMPEQQRVVSRYWVSLE
jgi:predicted acetyltransferase